ncbi:glyoxalase [Sporosarcina sp. Te-1]|uniref:glyoxalase n=1 Tax=Sporosarcina sp. Te-1 TaxID=2818390 RepID=UPI001A9F5211|nr:glyoxalase [Sporosarcina sp. Te-1]QTD42850.1 glyoxalase [Sporosarcina sp. Te-1]
MIESATFYTNKLKALKRFYVDLLELDLIDLAEDKLTVRVGESQVTFKETERPAFYHFAFNIPGNQFSMMKYFIKDRLSLQWEDGRDEVYFPSFDADSMYFEDPAGNIVELIGRRKRDLFGDLTKESFLNISEVGIVTPDVEGVGERLLDTGIPLRKGTDIHPEELNFLGRGDTYIVLVPPGRRWYFSKRASEVFPLELSWNGEKIRIDRDGKWMG